jgi:hypothetical protein
VTLYVGLNDSGQLVIESDYSGSREVLTEDTDGPTQGFDWDSSIGFPDRVNTLVREWGKNGLSGSQPATGFILDVLIDYQTKNIIDER